MLLGPFSAFGVYAGVIDHSKSLTGSICTAASRPVSDVLLNMRHMHSTPGAQAKGCLVHRGPKRAQTRQKATVEPRNSLIEPLKDPCGTALMVTLTLALKEP